MAAKLQLGEDTLADLYHNLRGPNALDCAELPHSHQHCIRAIHADTYFVMPGQDDVSRTSSGSRPGDSFADVVFGYLWAKLLRKYEDELAQLGIVENFPEVAQVGLNSPFKDAGGVRVLGPTWCDDLCVFFSSADAKGLLTKGGSLTGLLLDICKGHGMTPNLKKNKSELLLSLRGPGSRYWRKVCYHDWDGKMPIVCADGTNFVHVTGSYQHLGGVFHHGGDQRRESGRRLAIAHSAFNEHRRLLYCNKKFTMNKRTSLFRALVLSKAVYGMESWVLQTARDRMQLHSKLLRLYKRLMNVDHNAHVTDEEIVASTALQ